MNEQNMFASADLKILICYVFANLKQEVPATELAQLFHYEGIANYFEVQAALEELERNGHVMLTNQKEQAYQITPEGASISATLQSKVSTTLRNKVYRAVTKMLARYKTERDTDLTIVKQPTGYELTCKVASGNATFLSFSILLPNEQQANALREQILKDPNFYYDSLIALLTKNN